LKHPLFQYPTCYGTLNEYFQKISSLDLNDFAEIPNEILDTSSSSPSTPAITPTKRSRIDLESPSSHGKKQREIKRKRNERRNTPKKNPVESGLKILGDSIVKASENKMAHQSAYLVAAIEFSIDRPSNVAITTRTAATVAIMAELENFFLFKFL
jgi:hypothetical protein